MHQNENKSQRAIVMDYNNITMNFKCTKIKINHKGQLCGLQQHYNAFQMHQNINKSQREIVMDYNNITMNFKCTKIKQKITNGNHNSLLFIMCRCPTIEIIEMLMVAMIPCDGD
jgi:hypothetical protein